MLHTCIRGDIPETAAELEDYLDAMRGKLAVNQQTLEFSEVLMTMPFGAPVPGVLSPPAHGFQARTGMRLMPACARRLGGFDSPAFERRLIPPPMLHSDARTIRWELGTPAYKPLASERAAATPVAPARTAA